MSALSMSLTDAAPQTRLHLTSSRAKAKEAASPLWFLHDGSQVTAAPLSVLSPHLPENASTFAPTTSSSGVPAVAGILEKSAFQSSYSARFPDEVTLSEEHSLHHLTHMIKHVSKYRLVSAGHHFPGLNLCLGYRHVACLAYLLLFHNFSWNQAQQNTPSQSSSRIRSPWKGRQGERSISKAHSGPKNTHDILCSMKLIPRIRTILHHYLSVLIKAEILPVYENKLREDNWNSLLSKPLDEDGACQAITRITGDAYLRCHYVLR